MPEISTISPYFGERLKGIKVAVSLTKTRQPVSVVLKLRQVCARHFRNTFLYYYIEAAGFGAADRDQAAWVRV